VRLWESVVDPELDLQGSKTFAGSGSQGNESGSSSESGTGLEPYQKSYKQLAI
jgi:hypothetical protein